MADENKNNDRGSGGSERRTYLVEVVKVEEMKYADPNDKDLKAGYTHKIILKNTINSKFGESKFTDTKHYSAKVKQKHAVGDRLLLEAGLYQGKYLTSVEIVEQLPKK